TRTIVLKGTTNRLSVGDFVVAVENEGKDSENATPYQISTVTTDKPSNTTTITWQESSGTTYQQAPDSPVSLYVMRVTASPFGSNAPGWASLPPTLTQTTENPNAPYQDDWDTEGHAKFYLDAGNTIFLDGVYDSAKGTPDNPGLIVLKSG